MVPKERIRVPLRWEFLPAEEPSSGLVRWRWRAYRQNGELALEGERLFDTLTECMNDAADHGYGKMN